MLGSNPRNGARLTGIALLTVSALAYANYSKISELPLNPLPLDRVDAFAQTAHEALLIYQDTVRKHWPQAEVSDRTRWVEYSPDWSQKRVVDFSNNEIRISLKQPSRKPFRSPFDQPPAAVTEAFHELLARESIGSGSSLLQASLIHTAALAVSVELEAPPTYVAPLPKQTILKRARRYLGLVKTHAERTRLTTGLLMALIHTESHFNPLATSPAPAYGLMQIVPHTGGRDAARFIYNENKLLTPEYLYDPNNNIKIGSTYLALLYHHYLKKIEDTRSRLYCAIAAYNTGTANVARAFVGEGSMQAAVEMINEMTPQQVLETLLARLPYSETRNYVQQVLSRQPFYSGL